MKTTWENVKDEGEKADLVYWTEGSPGGAFLILFLLFAFYSVKFMSASPYVVKTQKLGTFSDMGGS